MSKPLRLVFMGTPAFAVPALQMLLAGRDSVVGVFTQPDQPSGRGMTLRAPPVKTLAAEHGLPVFQPAKLRDPLVLDRLTEWQPDLIIVVAYGKMLPNAILDFPSLGCINVHASLLPKYRGAAPMQWALARGEAQTGITIMRIGERMDAGDILHQCAIPIHDDDTGESLHDTLSQLGATMLQEALSLLKQGRLSARPQDEAAATYAPMIKKEDGRIDWSQDAPAIERRIRAFNPWPSAYTTFHGKLLKILKAKLEPNQDRAISSSGTVVAASSVDLIVSTGGGRLAVLEVQLEGKKRLPIAEFLKGHAIRPGEVLGA
ncbi:MAG: methionyl-tRNA formyltransferase [Deltaproteobacteria bacterium]|nr:methionyl-tRNA formyltransferase [Deltaproteobacteria bacterium]